MTEPWVARREFHPDAPRIHELVPDLDGLEAGELSEHTLNGAAVNQPWLDSERLWDRFLAGGTRWPGFRLVREGTTLPRSGWCRRAPVGSQQVDDLAEPNRILELYADGATVVLQALQFSDPEFARTSTNLALELDHPIQINAYLSPPATQGLEVHFDFHDVVVVQLDGSKRWRVWSPLTRSIKPVKRGPAIAQPAIAELDVPLIDRVLQPGDCLAIPRGFPHAATTNAEASTHLTIGIMAITWNRVLASRIDEIASGTSLAEHLPFGGLAGRRVEGRSYQAGAAMAALGDALDGADLRYAVAEEIWHRQPRTRLRPRHVPRLHATDSVVVTPGPLLWLDRRPTRGMKHALALGDRNLLVPPECSDFVAGVLESCGPVTAAGVDGGDLDEASRLVVLQRLATEGVVAHA